MKNRNLFLGIAALLLVAIGIWWWQSSTSNTIQEDVAETLMPELSVASARITDISDERINVISEVVIKNPFPVELSSNSMEYEVYVDSIRVIQDVHNEPVTIHSSDSTFVELPMQILADPMGRVLEHFTKENVDSAHYALEALVVLDVPIEGKEEFSISLSDTLPTFQPLDIQLQDVESNILNSDEGLDLVVRITNPNHYPTQIANGSFSFTIEEEMEVIGQMEDINIPAGRTEDISIRAQKEWGSLTQSAKDFIFNQGDTRFHYHFNGILNSDNNMLDDTELNLRMQGTLDELSDIMGL